ncbi:MAG: shikimate kinase, partial [Clostridiales bacterium]|nr:shikimate kinase [Clostridiales bacterium]
RWVDTDTMIFSRHGRISDIFEYYGEEHFRSLETDIVRELSAQNDLVISTGGGLVLKHENNVMLKKKGKVFFLRASFETLLERVRADESRPLLKDANNMANKLGELLTERTPIYEHVADFTVDTDGKTCEEVAREIVALAKCK